MSQALIGTRAVYISDTDTRPYSYEPYCVSCGKTVEHRSNFCRHCGLRFDGKKKGTDNLRPHGHLNEPGMHGGDTHLFKTKTPDEAEIFMEGHWFGSTDPEAICWCKPTITRKIDGCEIEHRNIKRGKGHE